MNGVQNHSQSNLIDKKIETLISHYRQGLWTKQNAQWLFNIKSRKTSGFFNGGGGLFLIHYYMHFINFVFDNVLYNYMSSLLYVLTLLKMPMKLFPFHFRCSFFFVVPMNQFIFGIPTQTMKKRTNDTSSLSSIWNCFQRQK